MVKTNRFKLVILWALCTIAMPVLSIAMLIQAVFGSEPRAKSMAIAQDECGNALFGGPPEQTMSARTGDGMILGHRWALICGPIIDFLFGPGHCLSNVDLPRSALTSDQVKKINDACALQGEPPLYV